MSTPKISRPRFPKGYVDKPKSYVEWEWIAAQLRDALHYWVCSVRPDGRPHVVPRWCVYVDGKIYYDGSPETRHARNIMENPNVSINLESGEKAIILEGIAEPAGKPTREFASRLVEAYRKYTPLGYSPEANQWDEGGLYVFTPRQCIAWTVFSENPTKFVFEETGN